MHILVMVTCVAALGAAFNIENRDPIVKRSDDKDSYFGYSVALHREEKDPNSRKWLLVGAPRANNDQPNTNRSGALFKCPIDHDVANCVQVPTDGKRITSHDYEDETETDTKLMPPLVNEEIKDDQWLGVSLKSQGPGGQVVICAHRYIQKKMAGEKEFDHLGNGLCYVLDKKLGLVSNWEPCRGRIADGYYRHFGLCQAGVSIDFQDEMLIVGAPGVYTWRGIIMSKSIDENFLMKDNTVYQAHVDVEDTILDKYSYLGMSVANGNFFKKNAMVYVAGAPRSNHSGQVFFYSKNKTDSMELLKFISGDGDFTSSFGYQILSEDINSDGYSDLIVSAPFYYDDKTNRGGKVYVYTNLRNCSGYSDECAYKTLTGPKSSRFGFSLASLGDINKDGYMDIAIGAPYEEHGGAIYIYLGGSEELKLSQVIREKRGTKTLGYSLSANVDVDNNNYPDLLAGDYEGNQVLLYKTRPIIDIHIKIESQDIKNKINVSSKGCSEDLNANNTCFSFKSCINFVGDIKGNKHFDLHLLIRENTTTTRQRVWIKNSNLKSNTKSTTIKIDIVKRTYCTQEIVYIEEFVRNYLKPIDMVVEYKLPDIDPHSPILNKTSIKSFSVEFQKDCESQCVSDLVLSRALLQNLTSVQVNGKEKYTIHSTNDKIVLEIVVENRGDSAYEAKVFVEHPEQLAYNKIINNKVEKMDCHRENNTLVMCDLGNPFKRVHGPETLLLSFEIIKSKGSSLHNLPINVFVNSSSINKSHKTRSELLIYLEKIADFTLSAKATSNLLYYDQVRGESDMKTLEDVGPRIRHIYSIENKGDWALTDVNVTINWPYQVRSSGENGKWLLYLESIPNSESITCTYDRSLLNPLRLNMSTDKEDEEIGKLVQMNTRRRRDTARWKRDEDKVVDYTIKHTNNQDRKVVTMACGRSARCTEINCRIRQVPMHLTISVEIKSRLWNSTLAEDYSNIDWVSIKSSANISFNSEFTLAENSKTFVVAETIMYPEVLPQHISYWYIILAAVLGILVLGLLIFVLYKCGFFKRKRAKDATLKGAIITEENKELL
ncbi:integrin alpha-PS1 isoform X2 [Aethina tumida]|uniref:integrin alpha-PS1 isoform X2 n=1 Tax=Aethina tumida TaxID=116153 RepID=UPI0021487C65|nr:integrin alpha-PS1 isoform X2 [Aethina tumida]